MGFWTKRILVVLGVIISAILVIVFMPNSPEFDSEGKPIKKRSIQENMANFYEEFSLTSRNKISEKYGEFVIPLDTAGQSQTDVYTGLEDNETKLSSSFNWGGERKMRAFAKDGTLMTAVSSYSELEGLEVIWGLDQDFIVKERFISDNTFIGMLRELAGAIDANFTSTVQVYFCKQKNVMLITDELDESLESACTLVP